MPATAKLLSLVPITVRAGKIFRGTKYLVPTNFNCSYNYAAYCVAEGVADWNAERFERQLIEDIKADIKTQRALMRCGSFAELHDVCDANCLGDLCDDEHPIWKICPGIDNPPPGVDGTAGRFVNGRDVVENAMNAVDAWIKAGHPND